MEWVGLSVVVGFGFSRVSLGCRVSRRLGRIRV